MAGFNFFLDFSSMLKLEDEISVLLVAKILFFAYKVFILGYLFENN
jgi:hypothetical protein